MFYNFLKKSMKILDLVLIISLTAYICCQDYNSQNRWDGECNTAKSQSPVTIFTNTVRACDRQFNFQLTSRNQKYTQIPIKHENENLKTPFDLSTITVTNGGRKKSFQAIQFHFHHLAEHVIDKNQYEIELHVVHQASDKSLAVYGVLFKVDAAANAAPDVFEQWNLDTKKPIQQFFPVPLTTPEHVYHYSGSLTTPTCDENVLWFVNPAPIPIKQKSLDKLARMINGGDINNRRVQPLNGRPITESGKVCSARPKSHFAVIHRLRYGE